MSSPTDRVYEPGDPSPYAPRWVRNAPQGPRRIPAGGPMEGQIDGLDDEADAALVQSEHAPPLAAAPPVAVGEPFVIDDIRVPRSLDPGIVPDPWPARHARLRRARLFGMFGRLALAGSVAAVVALLAMGKLSLPGGSGATEPADPSSAFGSRFAPPAAVPQEPPALAQSPSEPPAQVALAQPAAPAAAAPLAAIVPTPAPVAPEPASAAPALDPDSPQTAALLKRGQELAATGDIAAARLTLRPAAEARNAQAALALGATYDPVVLQTLGIFGVRPDVAMARSWYEKAKEYGSAEAPRRLELLATRAP